MMPAPLGMIGLWSAWQPIESAPHDGTVIGSDGSTVGEAFWHDGSQCHGHRGGEGWFWECDRGDLLIASNAALVEWMPFPLPSDGCQILKGKEIE